MYFIYIVEILPANNINLKMESDVDHGHITPFASGLRSKKIISQTPIVSEPVLNKKVIKFSLPPVTKSNEAVVLNNQSSSESSSGNENNNNNKNKNNKKSFDPFGKLLNVNKSPSSDDNNTTTKSKRKRSSQLIPERDLFGEILSASKNSSITSPHKTNIPSGKDLIFSMAKSNNKINFDKIFTDSYNNDNNNSEIKPKKIETKSISGLTITECPHCFKQFNNNNGDEETLESIKKHIKTCDKICVVDRAYPEYVVGENRHIVDDGTDETYFTRLQAFLEWRKACRNEDEKIEIRQSLHNEFIRIVEEPDTNSYYESIFIIILLFI